MAKRTKFGAPLLAAALVVALTAGLTTACTMAPTTAQADDPKVVLELFTSQGCSSCPSADSLLGELAEARDDVVALSFHVDYWDYIGWEDRFASPEMTARQRAYARALGIAYVYTPQLVVDGTRHVVGSNRSKVNNAIAVSKKVRAKRAPVTLTPHARDRLTVEIGDSDGYHGAATVFLVAVDRQHTTPVNAGENTGRTLTNYNVVRDYRPIGSWSGSAMTIELGPDDLARLPDGASDGCAVLVQENEGKGRIMGAELVWLDTAEG